MVVQDEGCEHCGAPTVEEELSQVWCKERDAYLSLCPTCAATRLKELTEKVRAAR